MSEWHFMIHVINEHVVWRIVDTQIKTYNVPESWLTRLFVWIHIQNSPKVRFSIPVFICTVSRMVRTEQGKVKKCWKEMLLKTTFLKNQKIRYFSSFPLLCKRKHNKILNIPDLMKHSFSGVIWFSVYKSVRGKMNSFLVTRNARRRAIGSGPGDEPVGREHSRKLYGSEHSPSTRLRGRERRGQGQSLGKIFLVNEEKEIVSKE